MHACVHARTYTHACRQNQALSVVALLFCDVFLDFILRKGSSADGRSAQAQTYQAV